MRHRGGGKVRLRRHRGKAQFSIPGYPLTMASTDEYVRVVFITTDHAAESRLVSMGINPGALLHILSSSGSGPIVVARDETRYGIDRKTAWHVRVVPASPHASIAPDRLYCDNQCRGCSYRTEMLNAEYGDFITLDKLEPGRQGTVTSIRGKDGKREHLRKMGIDEGIGISIVERKNDDDRILVDVNGSGRVWITGWDALHVIVEAIG